MTQQTLVIATISADNDLSPYATQVLDRLQRGTRLNPHVTAVALVDQLGAGNTRVVGFRNGQSWTPPRLRDKGEWEVDMADPELLGRFLRRARRLIPAARTLATFIGHGTGPVPECAWEPTADPTTTPDAAVLGFPITPQNHPLTPQNHPLTPQNHPLTPQNHPLTPGDLSSRRTLSTPGWARALNLATDDGREPFDVVFFDQCFQGSLDVLYEVRRTARVFVASPNYAWLRAAYVRYLLMLGEADSAETIAGRLISIYQNTLTPDHPNAVFWLHGAAVAAIADAVSELGRVLARVVRAADRRGTGEPLDRIAAAATHAQYVDSGRARGQYDLGVGDELMGVGSFAANLRLAFAPGAADGVYAAADGVLRALPAVHGSSRVGNPYVAPEQVWGYSDSLTVIAPRRRDATNRHAGVWRASLYRPEETFDAQWGPDPTQTVTVTRNLAYAREGGWRDFIDAWYVHELTPTVGQPLYVNVRALVIDEAAAPIALTATRDGEAVTLAWSPAAGAADYQLFKQTPGTRWQLIATTTATGYTDAYAAAGALYRVIVFNDDDIGVAVSPTVAA